MVFRRVGWILCVFLVAAGIFPHPDITRQTLQETYEIYYRYADGKHCRVMNPGRDQEIVLEWPRVQEDQIDNSLPFRLDFHGFGYREETHDSFRCYTHSGQETQGYPLILFSLTNESEHAYQYYYTAILEQKLEGQWFRCFTLLSSANALHAYLLPGESVETVKDLAHEIEPRGPDYSIGYYKVKEFAPGTYRLLVKVKKNQYVSLEFCYP